MAKIVNPIRAFIRSNFIAGLFVAVPTAITVVVLLWFWNAMDGPLRFVFGLSQVGGVGGGSYERVVDAIKNSDWGQLLIPLLGLALLVLLVLFLGIVIRSFIGRWLLGILEGLVARVPLVGWLYISVKQLGEAFINDKGETRFQSAVLVQFPIKGTWVIGFVTGKAGLLGKTLSESLKKQTEAAGLPADEIITVFVPTTPLPTQGFTLILPRSEAHDLPISVQDAIKLVISGGIVGKPKDRDKSKLRADQSSLPDAIVMDSSLDNNESKSDTPKVP